MMGLSEFCLEVGDGSVAIIINSFTNSQLLRYLATIDFWNFGCLILIKEKDYLQL